MVIGKLKSVPLRELWKHEEHGFSAWLKNNIEILSETLGISLSGVQLEKTVGSFQVDLVAEDDDGNRVIIENQLEPTDHDHLGKLLTYLTNLEAKTDFGDTLDWDRRDTAKYSLIRYYIESGLKGDESSWPSLQDTMIDAMARLSRALKPYIQALKEDA